MTLKIAILTISDRSAAGQRQDTAGPKLQAVVEEQGWQVAKTGIVPDEKQVIQDKLTEFADGGGVDVILTTGGTGFAQRDVTPEATQAIIDRPAPGLAETMRAESLKITPHAMLSRAVAGIRGTTLIVNLPGSPKGAVENLQFILAVLPHAVKLLQDDPEAEQGH